MVTFLFVPIALAMLCIDAEARLPAAMIADAVVAGSTILLKQVAGYHSETSRKDVVKHESCSSGDVGKWQFTVARVKMERTGSRISLL